MNLFGQNFFGTKCFWFFLGGGCKAQASGLDASPPSLDTSIESYNLLIGKITRVFSRLSSENPNRVKLGLRLGDLHGQQGRKIFQQEMKKNCTHCKTSKFHTQKALDYYLEALPYLKGQRRSEVLIQVGHLYEILGFNSQAIVFYKKVVSQSESQKALAESYFSMAEIFFKEKKYHSAQIFYTKALSLPEFQRQGLASYRRAWSHYNQGHISKAIKGLERMLQSEKLLIRGLGGEGAVNLDFQREVAKDFTVFVAHISGINSHWISRVYELSPQSTKIENISFLAQELEKLGQLKMAEKTWNLVVQKALQPKVRMEALVNLAQLQFKEEEKSLALSSLEQILNYQSVFKVCAQTHLCQELLQRLRFLVFQWNKIEEKNPSKLLIQAYQTYLALVPQDEQALGLAAQAAFLGKNYRRAHQWIQQAYQVSSDSKQKELWLLRRIEIAQKADRQSWILEAQNIYLKESPTQSKSPQIYFQRAEKDMQKKEYEKALKGFQDLVLSKKASQKLRLKCAQRVIEILVQLKKHKDIETSARKFAILFPEKKTSFTNIAQTSVLSQLESLSQPKQAWETLKRFELAQAPQEKKDIYHKNRVILARRLKKFDKMGLSIESLLKSPLLLEKDRIFALENQVWLSELQLDFHKAFETYKKLPGKKWLEMARLADLSQKPSVEYYKKFLQTGKDPKVVLNVCLKLLKGGQSVSSLKKNCLNFFSQDKELFALSVFEARSSSWTSKKILKFFRKYDLSNTGVAFILLRQTWMKKINMYVKKLDKQKLRQGRHLASSIKKKLSLIQSFEKNMKEVTDHGDWLTQILFLNGLVKGYQGFYDDLLNLPLPKGLSDLEQKEYLTLLKHQAQPYKRAGDRLGRKLKNLWTHQEAMDQLYGDFHNSPSFLQALLGPQIEEIAKIQPPSSPLIAMDLVYRDRVRPSPPKQSALDHLRNQVRKQPLNPFVLSQLIDLEIQRGQKPTVIYLMNRLKWLGQNGENKNFEQVRAL